jgi:outer membrane protein
MKNIVVSFGIAILSAIIVVWMFHFFERSKIGFVRSGVILQDYKGMKEANDQFNKELTLVQVNSDTLRNRYEQLKANEQNISKEKKTDWAYQLGIAKNEFEKYNQQASQQMEQRKQELTKKVLEEINNCVQEYGKKNSYKMILGTTNEGSILYGNEADDLTNKILELLNKK